MFRSIIASSSSTRPILSKSTTRFLSTTSPLLKPALAPEASEYLATGGSTHASPTKGFRLPKPKTWEESHESALSKATKFFF